MWKMATTTSSSLSLCSDLVHIFNAAIAGPRWFCWAHSHTHVFTHGYCSAFHIPQRMAAQRGRARGFKATSGWLALFSTCTPFRGLIQWMWAHVAVMFDGDVWVWVCASVLREEERRKALRGEHQIRHLQQQEAAMNSHTIVVNMHKYTNSYLYIMLIYYTYIHI